MKPHTAKLTRLMALVPLLCASSLLAETQTDIEQALSTRIDQDMSGGCLAVAYVKVENGELIRHDGFRCAQSEQTPPDADSRFEIGSVSKAMLGHIAAQMALEGKFNPEAELAEFMPDLTLPVVDGEPIRLKHLLTHTSGLPRLPAYLAPQNLADPYADFTEEALHRSLDNIQLASQPGQSFAYSNFAYMVLSNVVAQIEQESLSDIYHTRLFNPLGMNSSSFGGETEQGHSAEGANVPNWNFAENMEGVGGVRSSLNDMVKFAAAQLGVGDDTSVEAARFAHQILVETEQQAMGWGWMHYLHNKSQHNERKYIMHGGGTGGFNAVVIIEPDAEQASVVLSNAALYSSGDVQRLGLHLLDNEVGPGEAYIPATMPETVNLNDYDGRYPLMPGFAIDVFVENGRLYIQGTGQPAGEVVYKEQDIFENIQFGAVFVFERDEQGQVIALELQQAGQQLRGEREPLQ